MEQEEKKLRNGELAVAIEDEKIIWRDRIRKTVFALPWSFTLYSLTPSKLLLQNGFLNRKEDEIRLYRIRDIRYSQTLGERLAKTGTLEVISNDASQPVIQLKHIKNAKKVKDVLSQYVEIARRENGVRTSEVLGNGPQMLGEHPDIPAGESLGPQIVPDVNGDGIDDRLQ